MTEVLPPLGPDSVTWRYFGDWRGMLMGLWSGSMQNMHPKLAAGVWDHSDFFGERWERSAPLPEELRPTIPHPMAAARPPGRPMPRIG